MKMFYTASYYGKDTYQKQYDLVLRALQDTGVEIISPETGNYLDVLSTAERGLFDDQKLLHYAAIKKGIQVCDAVVIEVSYEDFQLGHEATLAIMDKKHVLCVSVNENYGDKIQNPYFTAAKYNQFNIEEIIQDFVIKVSGGGLTERFNLFLSKSQMDYIDKAAQAEHINKSEFVRELIEEHRRTPYK